jgi:hypothetical protein
MLVVKLFIISVTLPPNSLSLDAVGPRAIMFPFSDVDVAEISELTQEISALNLVYEALGFSVDFRKRALCLAVHRVLVTGLPLHELHFIDCSGSSGEACIYAACVGFRRLTSLEQTAEGAERAFVNFEKFCATHLSNASMEVKIGNMGDYFEADCDVAFLDTSYIIDGWSLDEGALILRFFAVTRKCLAGTFVVLISQQSTLDTADYAANHLLELFRSPVVQGATLTVYLFRVV